MLALCIAAFLSFGMVLVLIGANQAAIAQQLALDLEQTGILGAALALGAGVGITAAGPVFDRHPRKPIFVCAALCAAAALLSAQRDTTFAGVFARIAIAGVGAGGYNTVVNASVAERYGNRAAGPLAVVHASATLGAMLAPALYGWVGRHTHWVDTFRLAGAAHVMLAVAVLFTQFPPAAVRARDGQRVKLRDLVPWLCIVFGYVAIEGTSTVFAVPFAQHALGLEPYRGQLAISGLWLGVLVGRGVLVWRSGRVGLRAIAAAGLLSALAVVLGVAVSRSIPVELTFGIIGLCIGAVYPLAMALIGERFSYARGTAAGLAGGAGALGAVIAPWLTGLCGDGFGIRVAVASMGAWGGLIVLGALMARRAPAPASPRTDAHSSR